MGQLTGVQTVVTFGDDGTAVLYYYPHTARVSDAATAECFTVTGGMITRSVLVFDRPSFALPQRCSRDGPGAGRVKPPGPGQP